MTISNAEEITKKHSESFEKLYELYTEFNSHTNISSIKNKEEVYAKHFTDSLIINPWLEKHPINNILDIGSGGGFPAIPLAITTRSHVTALDSTAKKLAFVDQVKSQLKIDNLDTAVGRSEVLAHDENYREAFDLVTARAVAEMRILIEIAVAFIKPQGYFIAYKKLDNAKELIDSQNALDKFNLKFIEKIIYDDKQVLIFQKLKATPEEYPRNYQQIKRKPC